MLKEKIRFSIATTDIQRSVSLYRDILGLKMRPLCNPIAMFPIGQAEFEVCHREATKDLLGFEFDKPESGGISIALTVDSEKDVGRIADAAIREGAKLLEGSFDGEKVFKDFNGVIWSVRCSENVA